MKQHDCKKPFLCSCEIEKLAEKTSDKMIEIVKKQMKLSPEEILKIKTKNTVNIVEGSSLYKAVISAMRYYAKQEVEAGQQETIVMPHQYLDKLFQDELEELINRYCQENESNTPDFILAEYMKKCLDAFNESVHRREAWYGREAWHGQSKDNKK